ncbi:signal transduction histidine kinase [Sphingomonas kaistensis]|uniref:histidine kinase n=1 Tax=Sphingomonas kaistensis TaxID=298708 RepID=A0A7X5Y639_9SPHN|nr:signal transduction histidine kinase [Sphingomonas kaistensis]
MASALVPLVLFAIFQVGFAAREQRRTVEASALSVADKLILAADVETVRYGALLDALATSRALRERNWDRLAQRFGEFQALNPDLRGIAVEDSAGAGVASIGLPIVRSLSVADGTPNSRPLFTGYVRTGNCLCLMFKRAAVSDDGQRLTVTLLTDSRQFERLMPAVSDYPVSALAGPKARFIARSVESEKRFGALSSSFLQEAVANGAGEGIYRGVTLEGFENYTAFSRSERTGWTAHVALGSDYIDNPARRFLASLVAAALLSLLLAGLLIAFALRQMVEARRVAERMQQAQKMEALGQLTGGLAHDFNNLLTPVIGVLDQLTRRDSLDERGKKLATGALTAAQRAAKLTQQLLAFSRRQRLTVGPVAVDILLANISGLVERTMSGKHRFTIEADPDAGCVRSDLTQLELALLNLAINARDAAPDGCPIILRVTREAAAEPGGQEFVRFAMIDRGSGMDEETRLRALEPFFTTKPTGRGTGLGLAQVFGVVEQSGGTVDIESVVGEGTVVTLRLPACAPGDEMAVRAATEAAGDRPPSPLRLLVVDDEPDVRATLAQMLSEAGHSVDSVSNAKSALAALRHEKFDLVVSDYLMPEMNGAELIAQARQLWPEQPFLVVSGYSDSDELARSCPNAIRLEKPFTGAQLMVGVERALDA